MTDRSSPRLYRYPLEALTDAMGLSFNQGCRALGVSGSTQQEYRERGITEKVADRLACRAGLHPAEVWSDWFENQDAAVAASCADDKCKAVFIPARTTQRYCTPICRKRAAGRRYERTRYQADGEFAARKRADTNRRRAEASDAWLRLERRRKNASYDPERRRRSYEASKARRTEAA